MSDSDLNEDILKVINIQGKTNSLKLAEKLSQDHNKVVGAIKSLQCLGDVIKSEQCSSKKFELTEEGEQIVARGSHEAIVWQNIPDDGIEQPYRKRRMDCHRGRPRTCTRRENRRH